MFYPNLPQQYSVADPGFTTGGANPKGQFFPENYMKMKEFGPRTDKN